MSILIVCLIVAGLAFYLSFIFPTQWLKVDRIRNPIGIGIRVLQISDLHVERLRISSGRLRRLILEEKPDYIVLTGDFTMNSRYLPKVKRYAESIGSCGIPVLAVLGNHDYRLNQADHRSLIRVLRQAGVRVLVNESFESAGVQWIGIDDYTSRKSKASQAFRQADPRLPCVVLTHTPELVLHLNRKYDYLMAGHLHGKQFNLPYFFRVIHKGKLAAGGVYKGLHQGDYGPFYISSGIGQAGFNARFLLRSQVTIHEL